MESKYRLNTKTYLETKQYKNKQVLKTYILLKPSEYVRDKFCLFEDCLNNMSLKKKKIT